MPFISRSVGLARVIGAALALWSTGPIGAASEVLTVDALGGADFTEIQDAVDAAADGDTILVRSGSYGEVFVSGKSLSIVAGVTGEVRTGRIHARGLDRHQQLLLSGLECLVSEPDRLAALLLHGNLGSVRAQACRFLYVLEPTPPGSRGGPGALVDVCEDVSFVGCRIEGGGRDPDAPWLLSPALQAEHSRVSLYDCALRGEPGDVIRLQGSDRGMMRILPELLGVQHVLDPLPMPGVLLGTIPVGGSFEAVVDPERFAPPGTTRIHLQPSLRAADGRVVLANPVHVTIVDAPLEGACNAPVHVDAAALPGGDGRSWSTAYSSLTEALARAHELASETCALSPIRIWVAKGTYVPTGGVDPTFVVSRPLELYGGFAGFETSLAERDPELFPTILSGDQNGDDGPDFENYDDNSSTVVDIALSQPLERPCVLDGFVVRGGAAGLAGVGAGVRVRQAADTAVRIRRCRIEENRATGSGGGLSAAFLGTGSGQRLELVQCRFARNRAGQRGGGAVLHRRSIVSHCIFERNEAGAEGGGLRVAPGETEITNSLFVENVASRGGGLSSAQGSPNTLSVALVSSTFLRNRAFEGAGGAERQTNRLKIANSIFWRNATNGLTGEEQQVAFAAGLPVQIDHSCVQGWSGFHGGTGNIGLDPRLTAEGRLVAGSPCIDTGSNALASLDVLDLDGDGNVAEPVPIDLDGARRFVDDPHAPDAPGRVPPVIDMGAYERQ